MTMEFSDRIAGWTFWAATGLASLAVVLVVVGTVLGLTNQSIRVEVNNRQVYINQSVQLSRLNQELVNELGAAALKNNQAIRDLLKENGITVVQPTSESGAAPAGSGAAVPLKKP